MHEAFWSTRRNKARQHRLTLKGRRRRKRRPACKSDSAASALAVVALIGVIVAADCSESATWENSMRKTFAVIGTSVGLLLSHPALAVWPIPEGTNPYVKAIVRLSPDTTNNELTRIASLEKKYDFSWDGYLFREPGSNPPSMRSDGIRISLHKTEIAALSREPGVVKVEPIQAFPF
jgi:hypothetical protein